MYIRTTSRKNKDGSVVRYVQLAHNVWDPDSGCAKAKVLYSFGREDQVDRQALERLIQSLCRFLGPEQALQAQNALSEKPALQFLSSRPLGGAWALDRLWKELQIDQAIDRVCRERAVRMPVERAIFAMVANRALDPMSKRAAEIWLEKDVVIPGADSIPLHQLYRAMDLLLESEDELQREVFFQTAHLLNLEVDLLYFDTTLAHFELDEEDPADPAQDDDDDVDGQRKERPKTLRTFGRKRAKRAELPQVLIGLAVTREGIPVRCWVWPGKTADTSVIEEVKKDLVNWRLGRVITVTDRGFTSEENLRCLQRAGGHYIAGERMRSGKAEVETALSHPGRYRSVRENLEVKEIVIGDGEARHRYVLVRNPLQAEKDQKERERILTHLKEELAQIKRLPGPEHTKAVCRLISHPVYGRYLRTAKNGRLQLDRSKVKAEERLDGKYLLRTSDDTLTPEDVALGYKQLIEVEAAFRSLKHSLDLRPVFHRVDDRIRAHVLLCWLALLLIRVAERRTGRTWNTLRESLQRMHLGVFRGANGTILQRTETTPDQRQILDAMGILEPPRFFDIDPAKAESA